MDYLLPDHTNLPYGNQSAKRPKCRTYVFMISDTFTTQLQISGLTVGSLCPAGAQHEGGHNEPVFTRRTGLESEAL
jgi:hypothetical protein